MASRRMPADGPNTSNQNRRRSVQAGNRGGGNKPAGQAQQGHAGHRRQGRQQGAPDQLAGLGQQQLAQHGVRYE